MKSSRRVLFSKQGSVYFRKSTIFIKVSRFSFFRLHSLFSQIDIGYRNWSKWDCLKKTFGLFYKVLSFILPFSFLCLYKIENCPKKFFELRRKPKEKAVFKVFASFQFFVWKYNSFLFENRFGRSLVWIKLRLILITHR